MSLGELIVRLSMSTHLIINEVCSNGDLRLLADIKSLSDFEDFNIRSNVMGYFARNVVFIEVDHNTLEVHINE